MVDYIINSGTGVLCNCQRCGYKWSPNKSPYAVKQCPMCKSYKWKIKKRVKKK